MTVFLDTTGNSTLGIGLCARCSRKFPLQDLASDPNSPGLMVCRQDLDDYDPYRLATNPDDRIVLPFNRPDLPLSPTDTADPAPVLEVSDDGQRLFFRID